jgi:AraC-like DNA-binding protein
MRRLAEFIEEHLASDLTLQPLAEQTKLSPVYLIRAFKPRLGWLPTSTCFNAVSKMPRHFSRIPIWPHPKSVCDPASARRATYRAGSGVALGFRLRPVGRYEVLSDTKEGEMDQQVTDAAQLSTGRNEALMDVIRIG